MNPTVLICDDNFAIHESLKSFLLAEGIDSISAYDGEEALSLLEKNHVDLIILDIMLPKLFGTEVCRIVRQKSNIPIIMLSALGSEEDRIKGLQLGADDYVTKPFSPKEVVLRVQTVLRRATGTAAVKNNVLRLAELEVNTDSYTVTVNGEKIPVTSSEVKMLAYLIENKDVVLSRERLLNAIWGYDYVGDTRAVDAQIKRLRKKLPDEGVHFKIQSIYGVGFKLEEI